MRMHACGPNMVYAIWALIGSDVPSLILRGRNHKPISGRNSGDARGTITFPFHSLQANPTCPYSGILHAEIG